MKNDLKRTDWSMEWCV